MLRGPAELAQLLVEAKEGAQASAFCHRDHLRDSHLSFLCTTLPLSGPRVSWPAPKLFLGKHIPCGLFYAVGCCRRLHAFLLYSLCFVHTMRKECWKTSLSIPVFLCAYKKPTLSAWLHMCFIFIQQAWQNVKWHVDTRERLLEQASLAEGVWGP